jgi:HlyD family secretion protein
MRRLLIVAAVLIVGIAGLVYFLRPADGPGGTPSPTIPPVPAATTVAADARVIPIRSAELTAPGAGGTIVEVLVEEGDEVAMGAALVLLDARLAETELAGARAALVAAEASSAQAAAAVRQADANIDAAVARIREAEAAVTVADANRDALPGAASDDQERAANAEVARAQAALRGARAQATATREAQAIAVQAAAAAAAEVTRAQVAIDAAQVGLDDRTLTAPFAGIVASLGANVGEAIVPGTPVVRIADVSAWRFETSDLDESSVARIHDEATATVTLDALPDTPIPARVLRITPFGEATAGDVVYRVLLEPTGEVPDGLRWNMTAGVSIDLGG